MYMINNIIYVDFKKKAVLHSDNDSVVNLMIKFIANIVSSIKGFFDTKKVSPSCKRIQN